MAWTAVMSPTAGDLTDVWGTGASNVWAVGPYGILLRWDGTQWKKITVNFNAPTYAVFGSENKNVFLAGAAGAILHYEQ